MILRRDVNTIKGRGEGRLSMFFLFYGFIIIEGRSLVLIWYVIFREFLLCCMKF